MTPNHVDFDLHGFVGIRLLRPSADEEVVVERQIGPLRGVLTRPPDVTIEFVDRVHTTGRLRLLGDHEAAFADGEFLILRGRHKTRTRVLLPLDALGAGCHIQCERGTAAVPMLIPIINMLALSRGFVPLHASAFVFRGTGVLATGWAKGGKTETLLAFMDRGASYVGDEWVYLGPDGRMLGIPEPIKIWNWHLHELGRYRQRTARGDRLRLDALDRAAAVGEWLGRRSPIRGSSAGRLAGRATPLLRRQAYVHLPPHRIFGAERCVLEGPLDRVVLVMAHDAPDIVVEPLDPDEVVARMSASNEHERLDFMATYLQHRFAFPQRRSEMIERAASVERELLAAALHGRATWVARHPYPVSIPQLFDAIWPVIGRDDDGTPPAA